MRKPTKLKQKKYRDGLATKLDRIEATINLIRNSFVLQKKYEDGKLSEEESKTIRELYRKYNKRKL